MHPSLVSLLHLLHLLRFTANGETMARSAEAELLGIEQALARHIGQDALAQLMGALSRPWSAKEAARLNGSSTPPTP